MEQIGATLDVTNAYFENMSKEIGSILDLTNSPIGNDIAKLRSARLIDARGMQIAHAEINTEFGIEIVYEALVPGKIVIPNIHLFRDGVCAFMTWPTLLPDMRAGFYTATAWLAPHLLNEGQYIVNFGLSSWDPIEVHSDVRDRFSFNVIEDISDKSRHGFVQKLPGAVRPRLEWSFK